MYLAIKALVEEQEKKDANNAERTERVKTLELML